MGCIIHCLCHIQGHLQSQESTANKIETNQPQPLYLSCQCTSDAAMCCKVKNQGNAKWLYAYLLFHCSRIHDHSWLVVEFL